MSEKVEICDVRGGEFAGGRHCSLAKGHDGDHRFNVVPDVPVFTRAEHEKLLRAAVEEAVAEREGAWRAEVVAARESRDRADAKFEKLREACLGALHAFEYCMSERRAVGWIAEALGSKPGDDAARRAIFQRLLDESSRKDGAYGEGRLRGEPE